MNESVLDPCKSLQQPVRGRIGTVCFAIDKRFSSTFFSVERAFFRSNGLRSNGLQTNGVQPFSLGFQVLPRFKAILLGMQQVSVC